MLNMFLCTGRGQVDDYDYNFGAVDSPSRSPSRKKGSFGASGKRRATITKLQISAPSDFRHESHMGYEEVAGLDMDRYQQELQMRAVQPPSPTSPISVSRSPSAGIKRKPAPTVPMPSSSISSDFANDTSAAFAYITENTRSSRSGSFSHQQQMSPSPVSKKPLVPLLGQQRSENPNNLYVTETAKLRFDGALAEIEKALKEGSH